MLNYQRVGIKTDQIGDSENVGFWESHGKSQVVETPKKFGVFLRTVPLNQFWETKQV